MLIKFFARGRGGGRGPTEYLTSDHVRQIDENGATLREENGDPVLLERQPPPEVLRGNPATTRALIDTCHHKNRYTSGVIAFAAEDSPNEAQQQQVMDDFEALAFAGLDRDQYDILWVRHSHEGNTELHMVVPRQELTTGKALNIAPPGHAKYYDHLRNAWNYEQGWARPDDPDRAQAETNDRTYGKPHLEERAEAKTKITEWLMWRIEAGEVNDRAGVIARLGELGEITREGKDYVSVKLAGFDKALRLKGGIYGHEFDVRAIAEARNEAGAGPGADREAHAQRAEKARSELAGWIERRAGYHQKRYQRPTEPNHGIDREPGEQREAGQRLDEEIFISRSERDQAIVEREPASRDEHTQMGLAEIQPAGAGSLGDHLRRELGPDAVAIEPLDSDAGADRPGTTDGEPAPAGREIRPGRIRSILSDLRGRATNFSDAIGRLGDGIKNTLRSGYDRVRDEIGGLVEGVRGRVEAARAAFAGERGELAAAGGNLSAAGADLERASHHLNERVRAPGRSVERGMEKLMENRNDELDQFKTRINLAEYAASQGYQLDRRESSRNSAVMRRESDNDKIIIATDTDGHGVYFSVRDEQDNGSIVDFVQRRKGWNLGQTRKELRPWLGVEPMPVPERIKKPEPSSKDRQAAMGAFAQMQPQPAGGHPYLLSRGINSETLADPRFVGMIRADQRGNAVFPHYDSHGLSGYELKNEDFTGFSRGGEKRIWHSANIGNAERVVVVESAIDALSHAQETGDHEAAYISIGGQPSPEQWAVLETALLNKQAQGAALVAGTDADVAGDVLAERIAELVPGIERQRPTAGDWNEQLERDDYDPAEPSGPSLG
jgi:5S rRNA maturation endonuclease (ribonuclease M5)